MSAPQDPIREQLITARRNQILDAAARVFSEKGFHRATTKEIASTAGVSEGTIYNYFDNKADLLIGIMSRLAKLESLDEELASALQNDVRDFFVAIFRDRLGRVAHNQETIQALLPEVLVNATLRERFYQQFLRRSTQLLEQFVQTQVKLGHIRSVNVPLTVRAVQGIFVGLLLQRIVGDESIQSGWNELPDVLASVIFDGLSPADGG